MKVCLSMRGFMIDDEFEIRQIDIVDSFSPDGFRVTKRSQCEWNHVFNYGKMVTSLNYVIHVNGNDNINGLLIFI